MDTNVPSETELLQRARRYENTALAQIYDLYSPGLYRYALRRLGEAGLAEDCLADTFTRFLQALQSGRGPAEHLQAYLYRVAHNWIVDFYRREPSAPNEVSEQHPDGQSSPEEDVQVRQRRDHLRRAIRRLTPDQQQVILLKFYEGWENEEIARTLKKPVGAVKSLQHRALGALQKVLKEEKLI